MPASLVVQDRAAGNLLILFAATCWGLAGGIGGVLVERGWDPIVISLYRGALTLVFAGLWLVVPSNRRGLGSWRLWAWSALAGAGVAGAFCFYFAGMGSGSVAVAATLLYSAPVFVFIAELLSGRRRLTIGRIFGLTLIMIGVALLSGFSPRTAAGLSSHVIAIGLLSGLCYAIFILGFRQAAAYGSTQAIMTAAFTVETALLLILAGQSALPPTIDFVDAALILVLGVLGGGISFLCYIVGLRQSPAEAAALLGMAEPITAAAFGFIALDQLLAPRQILGAVIVIATVTALNKRADM
jgi:drug/metabolite transporter (DMT)-like permease